MMINKRKKINCIRDKLIQRGYKLTRARLRIIEVLCENDCLMYADEIYKNVIIKSAGHSISTVYRSIEILTEVGALEKLYITNTCYYKLEKAGKNVFNIHAKCIKCNKIIEINEKEISKNLKNYMEDLNRNQKIDIKSTSIVLSGICNECVLKQQYISDINSNTRFVY